MYNGGLFEDHSFLDTLVVTKDPTVEKHFNVCTADTEKEKNGTMEAETAYGSTSKDATPIVEGVRVHITRDTSKRYSEDAAKNVAMVVYFGHATDDVDPTEIFDGSHPPAETE